MYIYILKYDSSNQWKIPKNPQGPLKPILHTLYYIIYIYTYTWGNSSNVENPLKSRARSPGLTPLGVPGEASMPGWLGVGVGWTLLVVDPKKPSGND